MLPTNIASLSSNAVTIDNVDDYLAPSQACVNPAFQPSSKLGTNETRNLLPIDDSTDSPSLVVPRRRRRVVRKKVISNDATPTEFNTTNSSTSATSSLPTTSSSIRTKENPKNAVVKASMADCLACSGCVTTAETVMMEERHSLKSLRNRLLSREDDRPRILTVSPNSWADMCRHWNINDHHFQEKKEKDESRDHFFFSRFTQLLSKILHVQIVVDGNIPLQWTWIDEAEEFCHVFQQQGKANPNGSSTITVSSVSPVPSVAIDSSKTLYYKSDGSSEIRDTSMHSKDRPKPNMPLISGSCPALVCLVEKTLTTLVPHLSQSISPMSLVGMLLKGHNDETESNSKNKNESNVIIDRNNRWDHWAIMPCHDKKLEASRKDFALKRNPKEQAVDLVISTKECVDLVEEWIVSQQDQPIDMEATLLDDAPRNLSVSKYLANLAPSVVHMGALVPEDLLREATSHAATFPSIPLLVTTLPICRRMEDNSDVPTSTGIQKETIAFSSGGHANFIFRYAAKKLFGYSWEKDGEDLDSVHWEPVSLAAMGKTPVRSARLGRLRKQQQHYYEAKLYRRSNGSYGLSPWPLPETTSSSRTEESSEIVLRFAIAHGMQTMQRALKQVSDGNASVNGNEKKRSPLHYLEAMACPHGCVNGGGSVRSSTRRSNTTPKPTALVRETPTETRQRVRSTEQHLQVPSRTPKVGESLPRTVHHVVPPMNYTTGAVAGERVENMIW